jgi:hypothetical protein
VAAWSDAALAVGVAIVGGGIGVCGTLAATRVQARHAAMDRAEAERAVRLDRAAGVLEPIRVLLTMTYYPRRSSGGTLLPSCAYASGGYCCESSSRSSR